MYCRYFKSQTKNLPVERFAENHAAICNAIYAIVDLAGGVHTSVEMRSSSKTALKQTPEGTTIF